jgi:phage pi2 protein 07
VGAYIINRESRVLQLGSRAIIFAKTELKPANQKKSVNIVPATFPARSLANNFLWIFPEKKFSSWHFHANNQKKANKLRAFIKKLHTF